MSRNAFVLSMVYANWAEPNIRCELFLRQLRLSSFRVRGVEWLSDFLWFVAAVVFIVVFWFAVGYALVSL